MKKYNLAILETHPVPYRVPLYKRLSKSNNINLKLLFESDVSLKKSYFELYNKEIDWGLDLNGLNYKILKNYHPKKNSVLPNGLFNPGIIKELFKENYDAIIIYSHSSLTNKMALFAAKFLGIPIIFRDEIDFLKEPSGFKRLFRRGFFHILFRMCDAFLYSYSLNSEFYKKFGASEEQLFFHPCAVDNEFLQEERERLAKKRKITKKELKIPEKNKVILFTGRIIELKRPFDILYAYEKLPDKIKNNTSLLFVGEGIQKKELQEYTKKKNIKDVHFIGFKKPSELPLYYSIGDLFVIASKEDRSPKTMNEAMNFKMPIICTKNRVPTAEDMIINGRNGFFYEMGDTDELCKKIKKILSRKELRKEMGKEALKTVERWNFDKDVDATKRSLDYIHKNKIKKEKVEK